MDFPVASSLGLPQGPTLAPLINLKSHAVCRDSSGISDLPKDSGTAWWEVPGLRYSLIENRIKDLNLFHSMLKKKKSFLEQKEL